MAREPENFDDDQALLLMYLAGELPPAELEAVALRLKSDAALRAKLAELRAAQAVYLQTLQALDAAEAPPIPDEVSRRQAARLVRQWTTRRLMQPRAAARPRAAALPWWSYPVAAAAAILIAVILYGVRHNTARQSQLVELEKPSSLYDKAVASTPDDSPAAAIAELTDSQQAELLDAFGRGGDSSQSGGSLDEADRSINSLRAADDLDSEFSGLTGDADNREQTR